MKKTYQEYKEKMIAFFAAHREAVIKGENSVNKIAVDKRFTEDYRMELIKEFRDAITKENAEWSDAIRGLVKQFCKEFSISFKEDNTDHAADIANALKVIEMCGENVPADLFRSVIEPLKGSYKALKIVNDVLVVKWSNAATAKAYEPKIRDIISDYMGSTAEINEYMERLKEIEAVADYPVLSEYGLVNTAVNGAFRFEVQNKTRYSVDSLPHEIETVGKMYEELAMKYPLMFSKYEPTPEDTINS